MIANPHFHMCGGVCLLDHFHCLPCSFSFGLACFKSVSGKKVVNLVIEESNHCVMSVNHVVMKVLDVAICMHGLTDLPCLAVLVTFLLLLGHFLVSLLHSLALLLLFPLHCLCSSSLCCPFFIVALLFAITICHHLHLSLLSGSTR